MTYGLSCLFVSVDTNLNDSTQGRTRLPAGNHHVGVLVCVFGSIFTHTHLRPCKLQGIVASLQPLTLLHAASACQSRHGALCPRTARKLWPRQWLRDPPAEGSAPGRIEGARERSKHGLLDEAEHSPRTKKQIKPFLFGVV